ncbi:CoA transferase [Heyndrickxia coagulans]|nr:CoA transferase [Heyndrickxia coagulans]RGR92989.1 CoA transferase [Heyndrickxia coagulans]
MKDITVYSACLFRKISCSTEKASHFYPCLLDANAGFFYFLKGVDRLKAALSGIKVLDLTRVLAGPFCTMILVDLGAEVIKVEAPGGSDETRGWGPPFQQKVSACYLCANRNKKSITLDLKREIGIVCNNSSLPSFFPFLYPRSR